jgi:ABC-type glycerol-3-phosphate transport system substrate-binding protein
MTDDDTNQIADERNSWSRRTILAAGSGAIVGLAGCIGGPAEESPSSDEDGSDSSGETDTTSSSGGGSMETLVFWDHHGDSDRASSQWIIDTGEAFTEETGVEFEISGHPDRLTEKVLSSYKTGDAPDVISDFSEQLGQYITPGRIDDSPLLSIDNYVSDLKSETYDLIWPGVTFDGNVYGVPQTINARNWFYNESLVQEAGYDPASLAPESLNELQQLIVDIHEQTDAAGWIWPGGATAYNWYFPAHFMRTWFGTELTEPVVRLDDGTEGLYSQLLNGGVPQAKLGMAEVVDAEVRADSDEMIAAVQFMKDQYDQGYVPERALSSDNSACLTEIFPSQQVGLYFSGPWAYGLFDKNVSDFEWSTFAAPTAGSYNGVSGEGYFIAQPGKPLMVLDQTASPETVGEFVTEWFSEERQKEYIQEVGSLSVRPELNTEQNFNIPQLAGLSDIVEQATYFDPPSLPEVDLWNTVGSVVQRTISNDKDVAQSMSDLQEALVTRYDEKL